MPRAEFTRGEASRLMDPVTLITYTDGLDGMRATTS